MLGKRGAWFLAVAAAVAGLLAAEADEPLEWRIWTSEQGSEMEARFVGLKNSRVTIERKDLTRLDVGLDRLSQADRDYVAHLRLELEPIVVAYRGIKAVYPGGVWDELANRVPVKVEFAKDRGHSVAEWAEACFKPYEGRDAARFIVVEAFPADFVNGKVGRDLAGRTGDSIRAAEKWGATVLLFESDGVPGNPSTGRGTDYRKGMEAWLQKRSGCGVIPYREVLDELRRTDPRWLEVLGQPYPPQYLHDAVLLAALTGEAPPLVALRGDQRVKLEDYQKKENFSRLATLPEPETEALAKLILEAVRRHNPSR